MAKTPRRRPRSWFDIFKIVVIVFVLALVALESHVLQERALHFVESILQWLYPLDNAKLVALVVLALASVIVVLKVLEHVHGLLKLLMLVYRASDDLVEER